MNGLVGIQDATMNQGGYYQEDQGNQQYPQPQDGFNQGYPQNNGVQNAPDWRANIDPTFQDIASRYQNVNELAKALYNANSMISQKLDLNNPDMYTKYRQAMESFDNIPSLPDRYDFDTSNLDWLESQGIEPEDRAWVLTDEEMQDIKQKAYHGKLTNEQAELEAHTRNAEKLIAYQQDALSIYNKAKDVSDILQKEWGNTAPQKCKAIEVALARSLPQIGCDGKQLWNDLCTSGMIYSAPMLKMLASIGEMSMDTPRQGYSNISPLEAGLSFEQMKASPEFMAIVTNMKHPLCAEYTNKMMKAAQIRHGENS